MSPTTLPAMPRARGLRGHHVLGGLLAFFGIVLAVNGAMMYSAISTHTGLVANEPYRKGLHYNDRIAADQRQMRLAWRETLEVRPDGRIRLDLAEADGRPVPALRIDAVLGRPSTNRYDIALTLVETQPGHYESVAGPLADGNWIFSFGARVGAQAEPVYRARRRLWLKR
ncbi:MAG TPA: FixH family protein [Hyphomicrobiaceae bacterium]|nr:FixH family protein [Hyphomicrobiaceae bacterium]